MDADLTCEYCKGGGWFSDGAERYRCHECWGHGRRLPTLTEWDALRGERDRYKADLDKVADVFNARDAVTEGDAKLYAAQPGEALANAVADILDDLTKMMDAAHCEARRAVALEDHIRALLAVQDEDCRYDHNGNCQAHYIEQPCRVALARAAADGNEGEG